jgi:hypothetical protein
LPLKASEVDANSPFAPDEFLFRRVGPEELNTKGEVDPTRIEAISFNKNVESAPSVMRSRYSGPDDVLHVLCAERDTAGWLVYFLRVDQLPDGLKTGDGRSFDFFPKHVPLENCGAHSVVASALSADASRVYVKPSQQVINAFKTRFATALRPAVAQPDQNA